jgi:lysine/arginine/ornithine transport system substrate-binding protein
MGAQVVRIGTLANYPPFEYSSASGGPKGMEIELGKKYCAIAHLQCQWVTLPFTQLIPSLLDHKIDAVLAQLSVTAERAAEVSFTAPVTFNAVVVLGPKGSPITDDPQTMRGKIIGVGSETIEAAWAESHLKGIATIRTYDDGAQELQDLRDHKLDAVILDQPAAYDFLREGGKFDFTFLGKPLEDPMILGAGNTAIAVRKDDGALREAFDAAINAVREDGTFEKVSAMYFPFSMQPK